MPELMDICVCTCRCTHTWLWPKLAECSCSQRRCEPQLVRVIAIIMSLSQPDSLPLSTQAYVCVCVCLFVTSWTHKDRACWGRHHAEWEIQTRTYSVFMSLLYMAVTNAVKKRIKNLLSRSKSAHNVVLCVTLCFLWQWEWIYAEFVLYIKYFGFLGHRLK